MEWLHNTQTGNSKWWSWWVGLVVILVCYVILGAVPVAIGAVMGLIALNESGSFGGSGDPLQFALVMFSPIMLFVGVWLAQRLVHRRTLTQLTQLPPSAGRWCGRAWRYGVVWVCCLRWLSLSSILGDIHGRLMRVHGS